MSVTSIRAGPPALPNGRPRPVNNFSTTSSKSSNFSDVFADLPPQQQPRQQQRQQKPKARPYSSLSKVFTVNGSMKFTKAHVLRYGTTRSMPDHQHQQHPHPHQQQQSLPNGRATSRRLYASQPSRGRGTTRRVFSNNNACSTFRRAALERKEDAVSFFDIETDRPPYYQYRPGEEISGAVHMDIRSSVEIRFVELVIEGQGAVTVLKSRHGLPCTARQTYLKKHTFVIGTGDATWSSVLTPGHYLSRFRFRLPKHLPSSIAHEDLSSGFTMEINYFIKARICDDVGGSSIRSNSSANHLVKVLVTRKQPFTVQRSFDINVIPNAAAPVTHTEQVYLSCAGNNQVVVTLQLERAVFLAGDDVKLQLAAIVPPSQKVKAISCRLRQHLRLDNQKDTTTFTLSHIERTDPQSTSHSADELSYDVTLPTQTNLVTSFLQGCQMLRLSYTLAVEMRFAPAGGKLSFTIPLGIGPCAEPIYADKIASRKAVPIFNRPTRFPCFSPSSTSRPLQVDRSSRSSQSINVITKYSNSFWAKCFLCCFSSADVE